MWTSIKSLPKSMALSGFIIGALIAIYLTVSAIFNSASSTAAIGFIFVPVYVALIATPCALFGFLLGYCIKSLIERQFNILFFLAFIVVISASFLFVHSYLQLSKAKTEIAQIKTMNANQLDQLTDTLLNNRKIPYRIFLLAMVVQNPNTSTNTLEKIANQNDPELYQVIASLFDIKGNNRKGLAVMRLLIRHPNTTPQMLTKFSDSQYEFILGDVASNPKTPEIVLRKLFDKHDELIDLSLSWNSNTPVDILEKLAQSQNSNTLAGLALNPSTPDQVLKVLSQSQNQFVRDKATERLSK